jgi:hypothetical protein
MIEEEIKSPHDPKITNNTCFDETMEFDVPQEFMSQSQGGKQKFTPVAAQRNHNITPVVSNFNASNLAAIRKKNTESVNNEGFENMCSDFDRESSAHYTPIN